ncbi:MAG TPA: hypothetical protein VFG59_14915 [Anaeromyxobacter sp.]|nr:hypothetical protein [Anaeromyxobacter sp.]
MAEGRDSAGAERTSGGPEGEAWARVLAAWGDEQSHRAYLGRCQDLETLAAAGGRYRAVLSERPGDAMALRMRDEVVKRATVFGLATLPRTAPPQPRAVKRFVLLASLAFALAVAWATYKLVVLLGARS